MLQIREERNNHDNHDTSLVLYYWIDFNSIFFIIYNIFAARNNDIRFWPERLEGSLFWQIWVSKRSLFWIILGLYWVSIFFKRVSYINWAPWGIHPRQGCPNCPSSLIWNVTQWPNDNLKKANCELYWCRVPNYYKRPFWRK